jgi:hypothetical protein
MKPKVQLSLATGHPRISEGFRASWLHIMAASQPYFSVQASLSLSTAPRHFTSIVTQNIHDARDDEPCEIYYGFSSLPLEI